MSISGLARTLLALLALPMTAAGGGVCGKRNPATLTKWLREKDYAVRFVYIAPISYANAPMPTIFKQVETSDPRYSTWQPQYWVGVTVWISADEMRALGRQSQFA